MNKVDRYVQASTREKTTLSYQAAVRHFEVEWGGYLPATTYSIARYLADHAETLSMNTLKLRLAGLAQWHRDQGFAEPTKAPLVKKVLTGVADAELFSRHSLRRGFATWATGNGWDLKTLMGYVGGDRASCSLNWHSWCDWQNRHSAETQVQNNAGHQ